LNGDKTSYLAKANLNGDTKDSTLDVGISRSLLYLASMSSLGQAERESGSGRVGQRRSAVMGDDNAVRPCGFFVSCGRGGGLTPFLAHVHDM